jgi:hypothetical protein
MPIYWLALVQGVIGRHRGRGWWMGRGPGPRRHGDKHKGWNHPYRMWGLAASST